jgi:hypothetical protein
MRKKKNIKALVVLGIMCWFWCIPIQGEAVVAKLNLFLSFETPVLEEKDDQIAVRYKAAPARAPVKKGKYVTIRMKRLQNYGAVGLPVLPFKTVKVLIPYGKEVEDVNVVAGKKIPIGESLIVEWGRPQIPLS